MRAGRLTIHWKAKNKLVLISSLPLEQINLDYEERKEGSFSDRNFCNPDSNITFYICYRNSRFAFRFDNFDKSHVEPLSHFLK